MRPRVKYQIIYMNRNRYPVAVMCQFFGVSRSGYYDYLKRLDRPAHDVVLAEIIRDQQGKCNKTLWLPSHVEMAANDQENIP